MPAPTFDLAVNGTAPDQYATEAGLEAAVNAALQALWDEVALFSGKSFRNRAEAVTFGQASLPSSLGIVVTLESGVLTSRVAFQNSDDPLFPTTPYWGVVSRVDVASAVRDAGIMTLANVGGTADALTAELPTAAKRNGVTATSGTSIVEIVPIATNTGAVEPTLAIDGGTPMSIRSENAAVLTAGQLRSGRSYLLRRRGSLWLIVAGGVSMADLANARLDRITADAQMGSPLLISVAGTGNAATASLDSGLQATGVSAANLRAVELIWPAPNAAGVVTLDIDGQGAVEVRGSNLEVPAAGLLRPGAITRLVKHGPTWRLASAEVRGSDLSGQVAGLQSQIDAKADQVDQPGGGAGRGDQAVIVTLGGRAVMAAEMTGRIDMRLSDDAVDDIATRLDIDSASLQVVPAAPDGIPHDAWDVWRLDEMTYFTGIVWGAYPRGYQRRGSGQAWAVAPSAMPVKLVYGDHAANAQTSISPARFAHIATIGDSAGQAGWNGGARGTPATDLARAGLGFAGLAADRALALRPGALALYGARSEAVEGASLVALTIGAPLANLVAARSELARLGALYGKVATVESVALMHSGGGASATAYRDQLLALVAAIVTNTGAGQVNVYPPAGTWANGSDPAILGAVQALAARGSVPLVLASPRHWCGVRAGTLDTPDAASMTMLAELDAHATAGGTDWFGPVPYFAARSGAVIEVDCEVMEGAALVAPTHGVSYSGAAITGMSVIADPVTGRMTRLRIDLASAAAGTLRIAFGATGADSSRYANRCDLRDDWSAASATGGTLHRYAHAAQFEVA